MAPSVTSAQTGRSGKLKRRRWRRPVTMLSTMPTQAMAPTTQLHEAPIEPQRAAAHELESRIDRRNGAARGDPPRGAAPDEIAAERDDEGRDLEIGDDGALERADERRRRRCRRSSAMTQIIGWPKPEILRQDLHLQHAHDHADDAEDRADRQIDVAGDDDQHHAGRHHGDLGGLHRQVPQIARREEDAAGHDVEADPDDRERGHHADQAGIEFGGGKKASQRVAAGAAAACADGAGIAF